MEISKHAKERYGERIMDKDNKADINRFIIENEEKIKTDINKMIDYGEMIFQGKQTKDGKTNNISVFLKDCWIVLVDTAKQLVITLYKVDLGLDDDFNKLYVFKMVEKLGVARDNYEHIKESMQGEVKKYTEQINDNVAQINMYRGFIKNLEELNSSYKNIIDNNRVQIDIAQKNMTDVMNDLIGKKEF